MVKLSPATPARVLVRPAVSLPATLVCHYSHLVMALPTTSRLPSTDSEPARRQTLTMRQVGDTSTAIAPPTSSTSTEVRMCSRGLESWIFIHLLRLARTERRLFSPWTQQNSRTVAHMMQGGMLRARRHHLRFHSPASRHILSRKPFPRKNWVRERPDGWRLGAELMSILLDTANAKHSRI